MKITLNLATRPFADLGPAIKQLRIAMGVLALLSIALGIGLHLVHHNAELARARDHSLDGQIARVTHEREQYMALMQQPPNAVLLNQSQLLNKLFDDKAFSWTLAMEDLETVLPGGVQVSSLEPVEDKEGNITLHLRVIGPRDREVELVNNLEHSRRFLAPRIVNEAADANEGQGGPNRPLEPVSASNRFNFDILAEYNPATLGELTAAERHATTGKSAGGAGDDKAASPARKPAQGANLPGKRMISPRPPYAGTARPAAPARIRPRPGAPKNPGQGGPQ